jgi:hypothetical protein
MIIARDLKIVPRAAGEWDNTLSAITFFVRLAYVMLMTHDPLDRKTFGSHGISPCNVSFVSMVILK